MTYQFRCNKCKFDQDKEYSFKEFDQLKSGELVDTCSKCGKKTERLMGGVNTFVWFSDPRTLGSLADRNAKYRIPQVEAEEEKKREEKIKAGKKVPPKEIVVPWEAPERPKVDMKERKEKKKEFIAKYKRPKNVK